MWSESKFLRKNNKFFVKKSLSTRMKKLKSLQMAGVDRCWQLLAGAGRCWHVLLMVTGVVNAGNCWQALTGAGRCLKMLAGSGKYWQANLENMDNREK